jgi:hypothetical protein
MIAPVVFERGLKCSLCQKDEWIGTEFGSEYFMLFNNSKATITFLRKDNKNYFVGFKKEDKECCVKCLELLIGLEDYYDAFFQDIVTRYFEHAKKLILSILSDRELFLKVMKYRVKGNYIPKPLIIQIIEASV